MKDIVKFGPRPLSSANHKKVEDYIENRLKGEQVEDDSFTAKTPVGEFQSITSWQNIPGTKDGIIIIASHYDTNYPLRNTSYVGANDGASTSGLLVELANQLRGKTRDGYSVWLVWDDAEEAMVPDTRNGVHGRQPYGITHLAEKWQADGTLKKVKAFILADMIGDADLDVDRDLNSTPWLEDVVGEAAQASGYQSHFFARTNKVDDDHLALHEARRAVCRSHRLHVRLQQRLLAHSAGHRGQAEREEPRNLGRCHSRDGSNSRTRWNRCRRNDCSGRLFLRFSSNSFLMRAICEPAKALWFVCIATFFCFAANPPADTNAANQVIQAALQPSPLQENLRRLTDEIGGRVPGTRAMQHAVQWGVQAFTAAGADTVHTESFEIPYSWSEGATEMTATTAHQVSSYECRRRHRALAPSACMPFRLLGRRPSNPVKHVPIGRCRRRYRRRLPAKQGTSQAKWLSFTLQC